MSQEGDDEFHSSGLDKYWDLIEPGQIVYMKGDTRPLIIGAIIDRGDNTKMFTIIGQKIPETGSTIHLNTIDHRKLADSLSILKEYGSREYIIEGIKGSSKSRKNRKSRKSRKNRKSRRQ